MRLIEIGIAVVFLGIVLIIIGSFAKPSDGKAKVAVGGFIGPIPFGFANDKRMLWFVLGVIAVFFVIKIVVRFISKG
jgi:uncharacterized membrane protein